MRFNKFKPWVLPLIASTVMALAGIALWFVTGQGKLTLSLALSLLALVAAGIGFSRSIKLGFTYKNESE